MIVPIPRGVKDGAFAAWDVNDFLTAAADPRLAGVNDGDSTFKDFLDLTLISNMSASNGVDIRVLLVLGLVVSFILVV